MQQVHIFRSFTSIQKGSFDVQLNNLYERLYDNQSSFWKSYFPVFLPFQSLGEKQKLEVNYLSDFCLF